jgi:tRNA pseudouridine38-40 synthase
LTVAYHGGDFAGWQRQEGQRTVEAELRACLEKLAHGEVKLKAAGRTDAGVHARGQVVSAVFSSTVREEKMVLAAGANLPWDVSVTDARWAPEGFSAKTHSVGKRYVYRVQPRTARDPFHDDRAWHVRGGLDVEAMRAAAAHLVGELDYESFRSVHCDAAHARRYLWRVSVEEEGPLLAIEVRGNAFCRNMVRVIAGTLVDVGLGRMDAGVIPEVLAARDRTRAGQTAPARGLTLERVYYPDTLDDADVPGDARFPGYPPTEETWPFG